MNVHTDRHDEKSKPSQRSGYRHDPFGHAVVVFRAPGPGVVGDSRRTQGAASLVGLVRVASDGAALARAVDRCRYLVRHNVIVDVGARLARGRPLAHRLAGFVLVSTDLAIFRNHLVVGVIVVAYSGWRVGLILGQHGHRLVHAVLAMGRGKGTVKVVRRVFAESVVRADCIMGNMRASGARCRPVVILDDHDVVVAGVVQELDDVVDIFSYVDVGFFKGPGANIVESRG